MNPIRRAIVAGLALVAAAPGAVAAVGAGGPGDHRARDSALVKVFGAVDRSTQWRLVDRMRLDFPTFHTEGIAFAGDRVFLSAVEILEPTVTYPTPVDGYDRSPGKGVGHLFVMDRQGNLQKDIVLGEGDVYHPGGIDVDGHDVWVPVAEYRPNSRTIVYRVDTRTLRVHRQFEVKGHFGGVVRDRTTGHLVGNTWGSRRFAEWDSRGRQLSTWANTSFFVDYQDCQYVPTGKMLCGGVANLPQTPGAGGAAATYELGGLALIDLRSHRVLKEVPFQQWSTAGHVATRNPVKVVADGRSLTVRVAPDNGEEGNGTEILTYRATVGK
ncbi:DUF6454 family protein [Aeromicrobium chenweiae]|uniref:Uncharacterized protein n=1 Tax=Aeromicrobium chenweiae TaxID=2079793 RepID=A0A2S0WKY0_9ACTN|nr:DUF6454 family protein [Aeromicrobium chenweiae]AWB92006.1 hypothetical protein C3E78_07220 [Aeromicrobium chenweiae]TGN32857.1 hypothetical protein E4L97_09195 [Aeromicrobium chenweiae]